MLHIREEQKEAFRRDAERRKLVEFCGVLPGIYPGLCLALGEDGVRRWVAKGAKKARDWGMTEVGNLKRYIHLMFILMDEDFDSSGTYPWARTILGWKNAAEDFRLAALEKRAQMRPGGSTDG